MNYKGFIAKSENNSIEKLHSLLGLSSRPNDLITLINYSDVNRSRDKFSSVNLSDFYKVCYRRIIGEVNGAKQNYYDFDEGELSFFLPEQPIINNPEEDIYSGYILIFHREFMPSFSVKEAISLFHFFSYNPSECVFLSEQERSIIFSLFMDVEYELNNDIDKFSTKLLASTIMVLLLYGGRFYERQFLIRLGSGNFPLIKILKFLDKYLNIKSYSDNCHSVIEHFAGELGYSPQYLRDMLCFLVEKGMISSSYDKLVKTLF